VSPRDHRAVAGGGGIFALRILDVSIGTLRITYLVRGRRLIAGGLSFFESLVWLTAAAQVITSLDAPLKFVAYAGGYATGTVLGVSIERWIAAGDTLLRVVTPVGSPSVEEPLRERRLLRDLAQRPGPRRRRPRAVHRAAAPQGARRAAHRPGANPNAYVTSRPRRRRARRRSAPRTCASERCARVRGGRRRGSPRSAARQARPSREPPLASLHALTGRPIASDAARDTTGSGCTSAAWTSTSRGVGATPCRGVTRPRVAPGASRRPTRA
jgi:hypothetical protein